MAGRLTLRDELFLLAHDDDRDLRPRIHQPALGLGLAGAVLIDLLLADRIRIDRGRVAIADLYDRSPAGDPVTDHALAVLHDVRAAPPIRDAIAILAPDLYDRTQGGLVAAGILTHTRRRFGRSHHILTDRTVVIQTRGRARYTVQGAAEPNPATDALCALLRVLRLHDALHLALSTDELLTNLDRITRRIARLAPHTRLAAIPQITAAVDAAVGDLTVAVYR